MLHLFHFIMILLQDWICVQLIFYFIAHETTPLLEAVPGAPHQISFSFPSHSPTNPHDNLISSPHGTFSIFTHQPICLPQIE